MLSLNDCLETGAALENLLCGILIRARFKVAALCGDFSKSISSELTQTLTLTLTLIFGLCTKVSLGQKKDPNQIEVTRFTRLAFVQCDLPSY